MEEDRYSSQKLHHPNTDALKAYIEANYPRSAPRKLQLQTGNTLTVTGNIHASGNITYGGTSLTIGDDSTDTATFSADFHDDLIPDQDGVFHIGKDNDSTGPQKAFKMAVAELKADSVFTGGIIYRGIELTKDVGLIFVANNNGNDTNTGRNPGGPFATITKALSVMFSIVLSELSKNASLLCVPLVGINSTPLRLSP